MSKLTEQDQARIAAIEDYLTELTKMYGKQFKPIAPVYPNTIAQTEWKEERWKPKIGDRYYTVDLLVANIEVRQGLWAESKSDFNFYELGNYFPTEEAAQIAADKIKQLLKEL